jgi:hypothetical protein
MLLMRKLLNRLSQILFLSNLLISNCYSQCNYDFVFHKTKDKLDSNDLYFKGNRKYFFITLSYYDKVIKNKPNLIIGRNQRLMVGDIDTTFNINMNIESIHITYKIKKNCKYLTLNSEDLCTKELVIPLYEWYDFVDINFNHKYVVYRNEILVFE